MSIIYRLAELADYELLQLAQLRWDFFIEDSGIPSTSPEEFIMHCAGFLRAGIEKQQWYFWIALHDNRIVSMASVQRILMVPKPSRLNDAFGYLTNVYTVPKYRNQGIGSALLKHAVNWAKDDGLELLLVWPSEPSRDFYKRLGRQRYREQLRQILR
jgi:GNAT superfamily N-acetyltransferase